MLNPCNNSRLGDQILERGKKQVVVQVYKIRPDNLSVMTLKLHSLFIWLFVQFQCRTPLKANRAKCCLYIALSTKELEINLIKMCWMAHFDFRYSQSQDNFRKVSDFPASPHLQNAKEYFISAGRMWFLSHSRCDSKTNTPAFKFSDLACSDFASSSAPTSPIKLKKHKPLCYVHLCHISKPIQP